MARVSVLIPTYNNGRFLRQALDSVLAQTYKDLEIIVVDDGSTDDTPGIVKEYPSVRYIVTEHSGISPTRNRAIAEASGEFIAFLDSDDYWAPGKLEKQIAYLNEHPEAMLVFTLVENFMDGEVTEPTPRQKEILAAEVPRGLPTALIRKELFDTYGAFDPKYPRGEDTDFFFRISSSGVIITHRIDEALYFRRIHNNNTTVNYVVTGKEYYKLIADAVRKKKQ